MENINEALAVLITATVGAIIRYFEKRKMKREYEAGEHFKK
jgi:fluoride ion exporter CrcB/FEX